MSIPRFKLQIIDSAVKDMHISVTDTIKIKIVFLNPKCKLSKLAIDSLHRERTVHRGNNVLTGGSTSVVVKFMSYVRSEDWVS